MQCISQSTSAAPSRTSLRRGRPAAEYISTFVASRFEWHRALYNPQGEGSGGHIVGEIAAGAVMDDAANAISEIVQALLVQDVYPEVQNWVSGGMLSHEITHNEISM
jgi:hypothetical protein